jgi:hypothetical protein
MKVVGEIGDIKQSGADANAEPQVYQPAGQAVASYGELGLPDMLNGNVMRLILVSGGKLALIGCAFGAVLSVFATGLLRSFLFQVDPFDPAVIVLATISIFSMAVAASLIPAHRAASIEPIQALHTE